MKTKTLNSVLFVFLCILLVEGILLFATSKCVALELIGIVLTFGSLIFLKPKTSRTQD